MHRTFFKPAVQFLGVSICNVVALGTKDLDA